MGVGSELEYLEIIVGLKRMSFEVGERCNLMYVCFLLEVQGCFLILGPRPCVLLFDMLSYCILGSCRTFLFLSVMVRNALGLHHSALVRLIDSYWLGDNRLLKVPHKER